jgi:hypothetical protein
MYRSLDPDKVMDTVQRLHKRVDERFPNSGLSKVCLEIEQVAKDARNTLAWIERPNWWLRLGIGGLVVFFFALIVATVYSMPIQWGHFNFGELLQILEATTNELVLIGAAIFFLFTLEARVKRARALKALYVLRSIAHVIDMHQLTKDPSRDPAQNTLSSPRVPLTPFQLVRYLDYCSEMLSLTCKIAALYAQVSRDEVVLATINELESLTSNLTTQLWQKITIIHAEMGSDASEHSSPVPVG